MPQNACGVAAILLAAGGGSRLGGGKLLLPWQGRPLIAHVVEAVVRTPELLSLTVVLGHGADAVRAAVERRMPELPMPVQFTLNAEWREGLSASLRCGLAGALAAPGGRTLGGVLFLLGDQPLVTARTLAALVRAHGEARARNSNHPATAPTYHGLRGNHVILSPCLFPALMALRGDTGGRRILRELGKRLLLVPVDDPGVLHDVDTPEAYEELCSRRDDG